MNTKAIVGIVVACLVSFGLGYALHKSPSIAGAAPANIGPQHQNAEAFLQGITFGSRSQSYFDNVGALTSSAAVSLSSTLKVGSSGTSLSRINAGTCYVKTYAATIAASSTAQVDCQATAMPIAGPGSALTGVSYGDTIDARIGSTTVGTLFGGLRLRAAAASSTSGYITLFVENDTGATFTWDTTSAATGTAMYIATR